MAISVSAVANRSALHPDYYTGKKITVTPLNFVCKPRGPPPPPPRAARADATSRRKIFVRAVSRKIFRIAQKYRLNMGLCDVTNFDLAAPTHRIAVRLGVFTAATRAGPARLRAVKKIMHRAPLRARCRLPRDTNCANRCQPIRARRLRRAHSAQNGAAPRARFSIPIPAERSVTIGVRRRNAATHEPRVRARASSAADR
jgi:hypothetical protein